MSWLAKAGKYLRLAYGRGDERNPRMLIVYITSTCNQRCKHCFYAENLNQKRDLTLDELRNLSKDLGPVETILFSGGEPFLRRDMPDVVDIFYRGNGTRKFQIPTNATKGDWVIESLSAIGARCPDVQVDIYFSFDGLQATHDEIRDYANGFETSMTNVGRITEAFRTDSRFRFNVSSTVMNRNAGEMLALADHVEKRFHGTLGVGFAYLRGDPKDRSLALPPERELVQLNRRSRTRYSRGGWLSNLILRAMGEVKLTILERKQQPFQCVGGDMMGVVYDDGRVSSCELLPSFGNIRDGGFRAAWNSEAARAQRQSIVDRKCACTHECFITPSLLYHPAAPFLLVYYVIRGALRELRHGLPGDPGATGIGAQGTTVR